MILITPPRRALLQAGFAAASVAVVSHACAENEKQAEQAEEVTPPERDRPTSHANVSSKAAERLFADRGYEETSIRAIVAKARVNQAAINYHFGGKDGLYREVLPQLGQAGCSFPPTSRIKSRMANMLHLRFLGRGLLQRNAIAWRRSVAAIGLESRKPLSGIASCALTISPISWCSSCRSCIISSEAGVA